MAEGRRGRAMEDRLGAEVVYLFNSGFTVKRGGRIMIFDYCNFTPFNRRKGLDDGAVNPRELRDLDVTVFASHAHMDHFTPAVLKWGRDIPKLRYVLSYDINAGKTPNVTTAYPDAVIDAGDIRVRTLKSTDEGVAFIVEADGLKIYHAGDLNWWHWEGEPEGENQAMAEAYKGEINKIKGETFDIAFVPVDPRLENEYLWGLDYFMKNCGAKVIFPMHFRNACSIFDRLLADPAAEGYRDRVVKITRRGERFEV
jgi:L-ascorbate metabolism protein UlaG (beta-lactamase superfamily)